MDVSDIQMTLVITDNARNVNHCPSLVYVDVYDGVYEAGYTRLVLGRVI